ncbi:MAG: ABC transporter substrate-binding protein [Verrucomicrobiales bacterium]
MKSAAVMAAGSMGLRGRSSAAPATSDATSLSVAGYAYDRVRAIQDGAVGIDGFDVSFQAENIYGLNGSIFGPAQKYAVSEVGLIPYISKFANEDFRAYTLIPIFISRIFRHRNIFVRSDSGIEKPEDLRGKRVGTTHYGSSATTWIRGFLQDQHGIRAGDMQWVEAVKGSDGSTPKPQKYFLPEGFPLEKGPEGADESDLLMTGEVQALVPPITPRAFTEGDPAVRRLYPNCFAAEKAYFKETGLFPIMHAIAIRRDVADEHPELPKAIFEMYSKAKRAAYADLETTTALKVTLPWATQEFEETRALMGENFWPYGIGSNRKALDAVMRYTHEQGLVKRRLEIEEIFHPSTLALAESGNS